MLDMRLVVVGGALEECIAFVGDGVDVLDEVERLEPPEGFEHLDDVARSEVIRKPTDEDLVRLRAVRKRVGVCTYDCCGVSPLGAQAAQSGVMCVCVRRAGG